MIKPDAIGNATRWQGYAARDGFGMTLIRNQTRAKKPIIKGSQNNHRLFAVLFFKNNLFNAVTSKIDLPAFTIFFLGLKLFLLLITLGYISD